MEDNKILVRSKRRRKLTVCREAKDLVALTGGLPDKTVEYKILSFCRISSEAFLRWVADETVIRQLSLSTFRVGTRAMKLLSGLHGQGRLYNVRCVVGRLSATHNEKHRERVYFERLLTMCQRYGWNVCSINNHSKVMIFDTAAGRFVLEGSSNLNEAPNWEQYTFQQDDALYEFYSAVFDEMFAFAAREDAADETADQTDLPTSGGGLWN